MTDIPQDSNISGSHDFLAGGGEVGSLMRARDWSSTPLGPPETWPQSLRTAISILLNSRYPMFVFWGPQLVKIYNDGYMPITGDKHPWALGRPGPEVWPEIWDAIGPMVERVVRHGEATWSDDLPLFMHRHGFPEEVFFTFSYSPIRDESGGVGGMFCACTETTVKVQGERRLKLLRDLAAAPANAASVTDACRLSLDVLARNPADIPFALAYVREAGGESTLAGTVGVAPGDVLGEWPFGTRTEVSGLDRHFAAVPPGPWPEPPTTAMVLPLTDRAHEQPTGALVLGISSRIRFDEEYRGFFDLVAGQLAASIANARAAEEQRRRAEALAELDRAKTAFFSNVSHEFRTPLTLMLGPIDDGLSDAGNPLPPVQQERLELARRSGLRLQRLVNTLLDFSRIEAGRTQASYVPSDLSALTADLASSFRSATDKAGLRLVVDCPPLPQPVYVDRDMWEKIVLNLLSNAFKFTFEGEIAVTLRAAGERAELVVRDTGAGIPAAELPRVFERFRRIEGVRSRTHEGTGIGLALVEELARLHGGSVRAESAQGSGSTFTVSVPFGRAHLPADRVGAESTLASTALGAEPFVEEALRWLPDGDAPAIMVGDDAEAPVPAAAGGVRPRIVWADDNADMRNYVSRLLRPHYDVEAVSDGEAALAAIRTRRPDLVLADVMMPNLDGLSLVRALRAAPETRTIPAILVSARSGPESRIEGLGAGADDYLYKPFSARELLGHVSARLELGRLQTRLEQERSAFGDLFAQTPVPTAVLRGPALVFEMANPAYIEIVGGRDILGKPLSDALPELRGQGLDDLLREVMRTGTPHVGRERLVKIERDGAIENFYFTFIYVPLRDPDGNVDGALAIANDVTEQVRARDSIRKSEERYRRIFDTAAVAIWEDDFTDVVAALDRLKAAGITDLAAYLSGHPEFVREAIGLVKVIDVNDGALRMFGAASKAELLASLHDIFVSETEDLFTEQLLAIARGQAAFEGVATSRTLQGERRDVLFNIVLPTSRTGWDSVLVTMVDITERTRAEAAVREADRRKDEFLATLSHELRNPLAPIRNSLQLLRLGGHGTPATAPIFEMMERQVTHLVRLVDDLLEMSRISRGAFELRKERVELAAVIRNAIETSEPLIQGAGHHLQVSLPPSPVWLDGDAVRLSQILSNLLNNAARYTDPGGSIGVNAQVQGTLAVIEVRDTGAGIRPEDLSRIFDMFNRGERPGGRGEPGLGIGLALARRLAEMHGGTVEAKSEGPGKGSQFTIRLPVASRPERGLHPHEQPGDRLAGLRVLVVDDNRDAGDSLGRILELLGAEVRIARAGSEALELFATHDPAIVLLDIGMPELDGYEVARRIRSAFPGRRPAIVALTGWGQDEDRRRAREAGFDHHLVKPVDPAVLQTLLAALAGSRPRRAPAPVNQRRSRSRR